MLPVPAEIDDLIERCWNRFRSPGSSFDGAARSAIVAAARGDTTAELSRPVAEAARRIHDEPATITLEWLDHLRADGLTDAEYVEVIGVVAQVRALDTFEFGVGRAVRPLPQPLDGEPISVETHGVSLDGGWIPTVGPAAPMSVLSLAPAEHDAMVDICEVLYLAPRGGDGFTMGNQHVVRDGLTRSQIEFVASRTSLINDCFY
jgi:alkylhydroperoxidase family enzyme